MGSKEALDNRLRQEERLAKNEKREPKTRVASVPESMGLTPESIEKMGKRIAWAIRHNPHRNRYYDDER